MLNNGKKLQAPSTNCRHPTLYAPRSPALAEGPLLRSLHLRYSLHFVTVIASADAAALAEGPLPRSPTEFQPVSG